MTTVYRIQDKAGRGPYKPGFSHTWVDQDNDGANCPSEFSFEQVHELIEVAHDKGFGVEFGYGFRTMQQLEKWFTESERTKLWLLGYSIVEMEVDVILAETETQLLFARKKPLNRDVLQIA